MQIVGLGVDAYLKMLLIDNFVHTDLHPGNIFVRARADEVRRLRLGSAALLRSCPCQRIQISHQAQYAPRPVTVVGGRMHSRLETTHLYTVTTS